MFFSMLYIFPFSHRKFGLTTLPVLVTDLDWVCVLLQAKNTQIITKMCFSHAQNHLGYLMGDRFLFTVLVNEPHFSFQNLTLHSFIHSIQYSYCVA